MKIGHIELFVKDVNESKDFYCNILGFEFVDDQDTYIWVKLNNFEILLRPKNNDIKTNSYQEATHGIVIYSNNLDQDLSTLEKKGLRIRGYDNDKSCVTFTDLDDHWFQLVDPNH